MDKKSKTQASKSRKSTFLSCDNSSSDEDKRFIPEAILEEGDQMESYDFLAKAIKMEATDSYDHEMDSEDLMASIEPGIEDTCSVEIFEDGGLVVVHMDIQEPLTTLRNHIEEKIGQKLDEFSFTLQDTQTLDGDKNLVDQCVQGEGLVQINCELKTSPTFGKTINIVDVLKPAEEYVEIVGGADDDEDSTDGKNDQQIRWVADPTFKKAQIKLGIPQDPRKWNVEHVRHWLMWAVRQFNLSGIKLSDWAITGEKLSKMTEKEFRARVPRDPFNAFWTHFELLRRCKVVAINPNNPVKEDPDADSDDVVACVDDSVNLSMPGPSSREPQPQARKAQATRLIKSNPPSSQPAVDEHEYEASPYEFHPTTTVGPVQLWQFLLDILTDWRHRNAIRWLENDGEFILLNPELVAHLWGLRKHKPNMNYEKLSRALRYYYDGDMISKVPGKRFVYKFVCDLKMIIGYSASELNALVIEAENKFKHQEPQKKSLSNPIVINDFITFVPE